MAPKSRLRRDTRGARGARGARGTDEHKGASAGALAPGRSAPGAGF